MWKPLTMIAQISRKVDTSVYLNISFIFRWSNINIPGAWLFHIGNTRGDNIGVPDEKIPDGKSITLLITSSLQAHVASGKWFNCIVLHCIVLHCRSLYCNVLFPIELHAILLVTPCWKVQSGLISNRSHPDPTRRSRVGSGWLVRTRLMAKW